MDLAMAVGASPVKEEVGVRRVPHPVTAVVALFTESRHPRLEQALVNGAVRIMAVGTIIEDRRMFKEEGTASFRVTGVTVFVYAGLFELRGIGRAVRVMAIGAGNFPFPQRHVRRTLELSQSLQVALEANLCLGPLIEENGLVSNLRELVLRARFLHDRMAVHAGDTAPRARPPLPLGLDAALTA